ncbi:hypothetical protein BCU12_07840 [Vibrio sp. 10N.261.55.A7]|nr:hypothetical protein BCU12_07840 [Vibrio sp. 10N.261.55.A7]
MYMNDSFHLLMFNIFCLEIKNMTIVNFLNIDRPNGSFFKPFAPLRIKLCSAKTAYLKLTTEQTNT